MRFSKRRSSNCNLCEVVQVSHFRATRDASRYSFYSDAFPTVPMDRSYLVGDSLSPENERRTCGARERVKKGETGGEFDSLSAPPPLALPRNSRMRRKKARPLRVSFHSSGFVYPLPDKKAPLRCSRPSRAFVRSWPAFLSLLSSFSSSLLLPSSSSLLSPLSSSSS